MLHGPDVAAVADGWLQEGSRVGRARRVKGQEVNQARHLRGPAIPGGLPVQQDNNQVGSWVKEKILKVIRGAFHQVSCQWFLLTTVISYWNPCIWLAESKFVSKNHWQDTWWNAPLEYRLRCSLMIRIVLFRLKETSRQTLDFPIWKYMN